MSTIEELIEERDRLYQEHNEAFQAWMDAEVELENAIEEEERLEQNSQRTRRLIFCTVVGFVGATILVNIWPAF
jgi:ferric-dicitrate binding protein FerR (iron transport regulator)